MSRQIVKTFKVFCEGDTEYNYFNGLKQEKRLSLALRPVNMAGGGYSNFLLQLKQDSNTNCLAKFVVIDGDRAINVSGEQNNLDELIRYCCNENDRGRIPHILILDYPDFEYVACLHSNKYKGQNSSFFINKEYHYKDLDEFKADKNVYTILNSKGNSYDIMLSKIINANAIITNSISVVKSTYTIKIKTTYNKEKLGIKGTNIGDFFSVLKQFETSV